MRRWRASSTTPTLVTSRVTIRQQYIQIYMVHAYGKVVNCRLYLLSGISDGVSVDIRCIHRFIKKCTLLLRSTV